MGTEPRHAATRCVLYGGAARVFWVSLVSLLGLLSLAGCSFLAAQAGQRFTHDPSGIPDQLSPQAKALLARSFEGIDPERFVDGHVHMIGCDVNPQWRSGLHPWKRFRTLVYLKAAGVEGSKTLQDDYLKRLTALASTFPVHCRFFLYAMDRNYRQDGTADPERTGYYVPNDIVYQAARDHPDMFIPVISVHPYRKDAVAELNKWAALGVHYVKWLPPSMNIDPAHPATGPFYEAMRAQRMVLLSHTGNEEGVESEETQVLGNPLLLRKPLDAGVRVVALHCGSTTLFEDLDHRGNPRREGVEFFLRMMAEPRYEGLLYGDLAALTFTGSTLHPLEAALADGKLQRRLVNGSDYPMCAIRLLVCLSKFVRLGMLREEDRQALEEIGHYNPLLFDFVLKRTLRDSRTGARLQPSVFMLPADWP